MAKTYAQIQKQIDTLKREADRLKRKEADGVIARIKEAVRAYGLTASDLGLGGASSVKRAAPVAKRGVSRDRQAAEDPRGHGHEPRAPLAGLPSAAPRLHETRRRRSGQGGARMNLNETHDTSGNTWVGRGPRPQWLRDALKAGKSLQDYAV